jgi:hypothetical protein
VVVVVVATVVLMTPTAWTMMATDSTKLLARSTVVCRVVMATARLDRWGRRAAVVCRGGG